MTETIDHNISLPWRWKPREYQLPSWKFLQGGGKRAVLVWHRRAGKDSMALNFTSCACWERVGTYWHMLPQQSQARKVIWDGIVDNPITGTSVRMIDQAFPAFLRKSKNEQEMRIEMMNGSIWQLCGSDNYDSLVGSNPVGVIFSEFAVAKKSAWDYIRPILRENGGWAVFISTPRGLNHFYDLYEMAGSRDTWHSEILTVDHTGVLTPEDIEDERSTGMSDELINQEYFCSFNAVLVGSYYGEFMDDLDAKGRITDVQYDPSLPVHTSWDIGMHNKTVIWFFQKARTTGEIRVIDYFDHKGKGVEYYARMLQDKPYIYGQHFAPHDIAVREFGTGKSRLEVARGLGLNLTPIKRMPLEDRIQATMSMLPKCVFDRERTEEGREGLRHYRRQYDEDKREFTNRPIKDWSVDIADSFGYFALSHDLVFDTHFEEEDFYEPQQYNAINPMGGYF